ncbi:MAG: hypothetical protein ACRC9P_03545 [Bacteroides sp.]
MTNLEELSKNKQLISFFSYYHLNVKSVTVWNKVKRVDVECDNNVSYSFKEVEELINNRK